MYVSYNWLTQYVDVPWGPQELAERLTMAGLEVEQIISADPGLTDILVGRITAVEPHPHADLLHVCTVDVGSAELTIVAGAPNVRAEMKVPVATIGSVLPDGTTITAVSLKGIESRGMMCSEKELNLSDDHSGIMELPPDSPVGTALVDVLELNDTLLDVSVYANRPDCMSMLGIAREVAAISRSSIRYPAVTVCEEQETAKASLELRVDDEDLCPRYTARIIEGIQVGPSPLWLQSRIRAAGMRPINNVVDITNFVMLELGQPLHAFDYHRLEGKKIIVRRARPGETLLTLDGQLRTLDPAMLMICDAEKPACIGGVMGGADSEVTAATTTLVLEAANFAPASIRRTSRSLGIASEAAARFEKGLDPSMTVQALDRAAQLLQEISGVRPLQGVLDVGSGEPPAKTIMLHDAEIQRLLGISVPEADILTILAALEFTTTSEGRGRWALTVPPFRTDVELECDIIEEVARHYGYAKIPLTLPTSGAAPGGQTHRRRVEQQLRLRLAGLGLREAMNYTFCSADHMERLGYPQGAFDALALRNPLSEDTAVMRLSLLPGLFQALARNFSRQQLDAGLYELGSIYIPDPDPDRQPQEAGRLSIAMMGRRLPQHWALEAGTVDIYDIKGILEDVLAGFALEDLSWIRSQAPWLHPGRAGEVQWRGRSIAHFGQIHPATASTFRLPPGSVAAEIDLDAILDCFGLPIKAQPLPRYPGVERDLALLVADDVPAGQLLAVLEEAAGPLLKKAWIFDVYQGKQVPPGKKSVALGLFFQADRTLTEKEVQSSMDAVLTQARNRFEAVIR